MIKPLSRSQHVFLIETKEDSGGFGMEIFVVIEWTCYNASVAVIEPDLSRFEVPLSVRNCMSHMLAS